MSILFAVLVLAITALFTLSLVEKVRWLRRGAAAWHPVLSHLRLEAPARAILLWASALTDLTVVVLGVLAIIGEMPVTPWVLLTIAVTGIYTAIGLSSMQAAEGDLSMCGCFVVRALDVSTRSGLAARNLGIVGIALAAGAVSRGA
jgi:hypothetical protein